MADEEINLNYPPEVYNNVRIPSIPDHELILKIGAVIKLLRNLCTKDGLCNGTRPKVLELFEYNIKAQIITGCKKGNITFIPRITSDSKDCNTLRFILFRRQFPISLAFVITINKSQGQTFEEIGLYYRQPLFTHGQLYVFLSRSKNKENIFIENKSDKNILKI